MNTEEFKDIQGYEGKYRINRDGDIYSVKRNELLKWKIKKGYYIIILSNEGHEKTYYIHRLIALHFIPNPENHPIVVHIDKNKTNNNINNLKWCSYNDASKYRKVKGGISIVRRVLMNKKESFSYLVYIRKEQRCFKTYEEAKNFLYNYIEKNEK